MQHYYEHLNDAEGTGMEFRGSGGNDYVEMLNINNQLAPILRIVKDAVLE